MLYMYLNERYIIEIMYILYLAKYGNSNRHTQSQ